MSLSARRAWIEMLLNPSKSSMPIPVALRKESVDRNTYGRAVLRIVSVSLSARRAWIEMPSSALKCTKSPVALRKESVDRNFVLCPCCGKEVDVALRKESVDRNTGALAKALKELSRSPQGERG